MDLGPQNHNKDGLLGPNPIRVVYMDPLDLWKSTIKHIGWALGNRMAVRGYMLP